MTMTFEQVVETIRQFPAEQQEMLIDLIRGWRIETRRLEITRDAQESLTVSKRATQATISTGGDY